MMDGIIINHVTKIISKCIMTKKEKKGGGKNGGELSSATVGDSRFAALLDAPIFKKTSNQAHKVAIDDRFQSMLTDERFHMTPGQVVDAYGRKKKKGKADSELHNLYELEASGKDGAAEEQGVAESKGEKGGKRGDTMSMEERLDYLTKLARGEVSEDSSSDDDSDAYEVEQDDDEDDDEDVEVDEEDGRLKKSPLDIPGDDEEIEYGDATRRISIMNCDWSHIKAQDLMVILQSFCPTGKQVLKVTVYPSDFGKERMAQEEKFGPQGIWKHPEEDVESELDDNEEEEDENEDLYEDIEEFGSDDDEDDDGEEEDGEDAQSDEEEAAAVAKGAKYGDFARKSGAVGIVLHRDLQRRKKRQQDDAADDDDEEDGDEEEEGKDGQSAGRSRGSHDSGFNEIALREYELSKLRYFFAVAECDSAETANILYEQLDDVELEDSAMALELRFVPDDLDLSAREVRDSCNAMPAQYKPPEFAVNALQHTTVKCTWDEGEKDREQKLTNISSWRQLKDSDFQQYIASSDSDDEDDDEDEEVDSEDDAAGSFAGASMMSVSKKQKRAKALRAMLLGEGADSDRDSAADDDDDNLLSKSSKKKQQEDDFFLDDNLDEDEEGEMVMTYIPEAGKELLDKKREKEQELTPYELDLKKSADISKARKDAKKAYIQSKIDEQDRVKEEITALKTKKNKVETVEEKEKKAKDIAKLTAIMGDAGADDDRLGSKADKKKHKKDKKRGKNAAAEDEDQKQRKADQIGANFNIDVSDDRFKKVFEGDAAFGIDRTAHEFKQTPGMKKILEEQRKSRTKKESSASSSSNNKSANANDGNNNAAAPVEGGHNKQQMNQLVNRLKRKFNQ